MAGLRTQRLALLGARGHFARGQRVVAIEGHAAVQRNPAAQLEALDGGGIDVHALREVVDRDAVALPHAQVQAARRGAAAGQAVRHILAVDLVLELGVEGGQVARQAFAIVEQHAQFGRGAAFRLELRIAQQRHGALRAQADDAVRHQVDVRRLVALAHAALEGPHRRRVPDQVAARAPLAAELLVAVVTRAGGQRQAIHDAPFVFREQRPLVLPLVQRRRHQRVLELLLAPLAAHGQVVALVEQRHRPLGVEHPVVVFQVALVAVGRLARRVHRVRAADGLGRVVDQAGIGADRTAVTAQVGQRVALAVELHLGFIPAALAVARHAGIQRAQLAIGVVEGLPVAVHVEHDVVVAVGRQRQPQAHVLLRAVAQAAEAGDVAGVVAAVVLGLVDGIAAVRAQAAVVPAAQAQAQLVGLQGATQVEGGAVVIAKAVVALRRAVQRQLAGPFLPDLAGDDVDHAAHRVGPVQGGHGAAHHLDALDGGHRRDEVGVHVAKAVGARARTILVQPLAVDEHQRVVAGHAADADVHAACLAAPLHRHPFHVGHRVGQVVERPGFQLFARDHRNGRRRIPDLLLEARRRHHDGIHLRHAHGVFQAGRTGLRLGAARRGDGQRERQKTEAREGCCTCSPGAVDAFLSRHGNQIKTALGGGARTALIGIFYGTAMIGIPII
ncbi:hypothetical protein D3C86_1130300 [compost metagenome]